MATVTAEHGDALAGHDAGSHEGGHHETAEQRDHKERIALWIFIAGDGIFLLLELFAWFYLRALNTNGMWRGVKCTTASPCTDGLGNPITHEIAKANPAYSLSIAGLAIVAALVIWGVEGAVRSTSRTRGESTGLVTVGVVVLLGAVALQCYQFGQLPFSTIDGTYASAFEFFMGSTLAHLILLTFIGLGLWNNVRIGRYEAGRWQRARLIRIFAAWIALSASILAIVMSTAT